MLSVYICCSLFGLIIGIIRRRFDTRVFANICKELSIDVTKDLFQRKILTSKITARVNNIKKFTNFFEQYLPYLVKSFIYIIIASSILFCRKSHY